MGKVKKHIRGISFVYLSMITLIVLFIPKNSFSYVYGNEVYQIFNGSIAQGNYDQIKNEPDVPAIDASQGFLIRVIQNEYDINIENSYDFYLMPVDTNWKYVTNFVYGITHNQGSFSSGVINFESIPILSERVQMLWNFIYDDIRMNVSTNLIETNFKGPFNLTKIMCSVFSSVHILNTLKEDLFQLASDVIDQATQTINGFGKDALWSAIIFGMEDEIENSGYTAAELRTEIKYNEIYDSFFGVNDSILGTKLDELEDYLNFAGHGETILFKTGERMLHAFIQAFRHGNSTIESLKGALTAGNRELGSYNSTATLATFVGMYLITETGLGSASTYVLSALSEIDNINPPFSYENSYILNVCNAFKTTNEINNSKESLVQNLRYMLNANLYLIEAFKELSFYSTPLSWMQGVSKQDVIDSFENENSKIGQSMAFWNSIKLNSDWLSPAIHIVEFLNNGNIVIENDTVSGSLQINLTAYDNLGVSKIMFYAESQLINETIINPPETTVTKSTSFDTISLPIAGHTTFEVIVYDSNGLNDTFTIYLDVDNTFGITTSVTPETLSVGSPLTVSGRITDSSGDGIDNINVWETTGFCNGATVETTGGGYFTINGNAPENKGTYDISVEARLNGESKIATASFNVTDPSEGHDLSATFFSLNSNIVSPNSNITLYASFNNGGEYAEAVNVYWSVKPSDASSSYSHSNNYYGTLSPSGGTGQQSVNLPVGMAEGTWTAEVYVELANDEYLKNNKHYKNFYVGESQDYTEYSVYFDVLPKNASQPTVVSTSYSEDIELQVISTSSNGDVTYSLDGSEERLSIGEYATFYANQVVLYHEDYDYGEPNVFYQLWTYPPVNDFDITPDQNIAPQGTEVVFKMFSNSSISSVGFLEHYGDGGIVETWNWATRSISGGTELYCTIPQTVAVKTYEFWVRMNVGIQKQTQYLELTVLPKHDISVSILSPSQSTEFTQGDTIPVSAIITAANNYTEHLNITLNITSSNGYYYTKTEHLSVNGTSTITFSNWSTLGLSSGQYTITVETESGNDINSSNNSQSSIITLNQLPMLDVVANSNFTTATQGNTVELYAIVTSGGINVEDASVSAHITSPSGIQSNPIMIFDQTDGRYEHSLYLNEYGNYSGNIIALKSSYHSGDIIFPDINVENSPPDTIITSNYPSDGEWINQNSVLFSWIGSDSGTPLSALTYSNKIGSGAWSDWSFGTNNTVNDLLEGINIFYVKAKDESIEDTTPDVITFYVDTVSPIITITTDGGNGPGNNFSTTQSHISLRGNTTDISPSSGLEFSIVNTDDPNEGTASNWQFIVELHSGANFITVYGMDNVGNIGQGTIIVYLETDPCDYHSTDYNPQDWHIGLSELLRTIQLYNIGSYHCDPAGEDGYNPGDGDQTCPSHKSDYNPPDNSISLSELLRLIQLYNIGEYHCDTNGEDGYNPGP